MGGLLKIAEKKILEKDSRFFFTLSNISILFNIKKTVFDNIKGNIYKYMCAEHNIAKALYYNVAATL